MLHDIKLFKYLGARSQGKMSKLENAPSCVLIRAKWPCRSFMMLQEQNLSSVETLKIPFNTERHERETYMYLIKLISTQII